LISLKKIFSNDFKHLAMSTGFGEIERFFLNFKPSDQKSAVTSRAVTLVTVIPTVTEIQQ
jgi:hypothetical protein